MNVTNTIAINLTLQTIGSSNMHALSFHISCKIEFSGGFKKHYIYTVTIFDLKGVLRPITQDESDSLLMLKL